MLTVTIVEDNLHLRETLAEVLSDEGFAVTAYANVEALGTPSAQAVAGVFILDLNLPGEDGISFARRLRRDYGAVGIIMLTARIDPAERQHGYESGADIYLPNPSSPGELVAAIRALERRLPAAADPVLRFDPQRMVLAGPAATVPLSSSEVDLLRAFLSAPEGRLSSAEIERISGSAGTRGAIEVRLTRLRRKLATAGADGNPLGAVRGWGYQLAAPLALAS